MHETLVKVRDAYTKLIAAVLASVPRCKWWWAGGGGAAVVVIAALVVVFGGFFGPSGKAICTTALEHARDYGVIPATATLANTDAKSTDVENRRLCTARAGGNEYRLTADITCKDMKNKDCIALYSVERADGLSTYQVRQVPDDDQDAAIPADAGNAGGGEAQNTGNAQNTGDAQGTGLDSDIQPTTGTHASESNQQASPQQ